MMNNLLTPFHLEKWIEQNKEHLTPPVNNKILYPCKDFIIMVVGGPNKRKDFHVNPTEELFYQIKGNITLQVQHKKKLELIHIKEGEMFLLPKGMPHSPQRFENTVGLVVEKVRNKKQKDTFQWYCPICNNICYQVSEHVSDIELDLPRIFETVYANPLLITCKKESPECKKIQ